MNYNWHWGVLLDAPYPLWIASGFATTCLIAVCAWSIAFTLGSAVAVARTCRSRAWRGVGTAYVEIFRNVPVLVQIFIWFYVVPELLPLSWGVYVKRGLPHAQFWTAVIALGFYTAAKVAEHVRSGIDTLGPGQRNGALALALSGAQTYRMVLLPAAYRVVLPSLTSEFMSVFKNSSLALTIGVLELTAQANQIAEYTFQPLEIFVCTTLLYALVSLCVVGGMAALERRMRVAGTVTAHV